MSGQPAAGFAARSGNVLRTVIGAIDGLLVPITYPGKEWNARKYRCRKGFWALNVQAVVDAQSRFLYASIIAPGASHDSYAYKSSSLFEKITSVAAQHLQPHGFTLIGDDAYAVPTSARSSSSRTGVDQAPGTRSSANSPGDRASSTAVHSLAFGAFSGA